MNPLETIAQVDVRPLAERIQEHSYGPTRLLLLEAPVPSVVSFSGSFRTHPDFAAGEELLQELTVSMLDRGTRRRDRFAVAEFLENRGAQLHVSSEGLRVRFSGRALTEDVAEVLHVAAEQFREPLLDEEEFGKAKAQLAAKLQHAMDSTGSQASVALARRLYGPSHPNYARPPGEELQQLAELTVADVRRYHEQHFGANDLIIAFAGDLDAGTADAATNELGTWEPSAISGGLSRETHRPEQGEVRIPMPDKSNIDVRMGHTLQLLRQDPDYVPLFVATYVLGGNFSARLMAIIRDEMGLTYGIRSGLVGVTTEYDGYFQVSVTLSGDKLERGVRATQAEVERFAREGITADELDEKKTTITGSYKVGLATTGGLASALLNNAERGFDVGYLDRYAAEVEALTLDQVNEAIRTHIRPEAIQTAMAGTF